MVIEKITTGLKYITWTTPQIKKPLKEPRIQTDQTPDITQKTRIHVFKFFNTTNTACGENCKSSWVQTHS